MRTSGNIARIGLLAMIFVACGHAARLRAGAIVLTDVLPQGFFQTQPHKPDAKPEKIPEIDRALESFKAGRYDECLQRLEAAAGKHPNLLPPRLILAKLFLASKQVPQGRAALEQAAAKHPQRPEIYLQFAALALGEGRLTDAWLQFEKTLSLVSDQAETEPQRRFLIECHAGLATVAERRGQWATAEKHVGVWLQADPNSGPAHERLARAMVAQDRPDEAYRILTQAAELADKPRMPELVLAILITQLGKADQAEPWIVRAAEQSAEDAQSQQAIAAWYLQQGQPEKSQQHADAAAKLDPDSKELKRLRGLIARHLKDYEEAEGYFDGLYQEFPADFQASNQLALALVEQPDEPKRRRALQLAAVNARQYPKSHEALSTLGWVYYRLGRLEEAERALQAAISGGKASPETAYYLAHVLADRDRLDDVRRLLRGALDAPGAFAFHKEANQWLDRITQKPE